MQTWWNETFLVVGKWQQDKHSSRHPCAAPTAAPAPAHRVFSRSGGKPRRRATRGVPAGNERPGGREGPVVPG